jgi:hypothetical protein
MNEECLEAFRNLNEILTSDPVVRQPDFTRSFILDTDASGYALGVVLVQIDDNNVEYVVGYYSRQLKGAELYYPPVEKECAGVIFGVKENRIYLECVHFKIRVDCKPLNWLMSMKDPAGRLARWAIYLQSFDFEIKGSHHANVDALSRPVVNSIISNESIDEKTSIDIMDDECLKNFVKTSKHANGASRKQIRRIENLARHYKVDQHGYWYRKDVTIDAYNLMVPEKEHRESIIDKAHQLGHFGNHATYERVREKYYWKIYNYIMKDATGSELKDAYPLHKLKVTNERSGEDSKSDEVEKIVDHKKDDKNIMYYLVKWKNFDDSHNSWVAEQDFDTTEYIDKYRKSINEGQIKKRGRPRKNILLMTSILFMIFRIV